MLFLLQIISGGPGLFLFVLWWVFACYCCNRNIYSKWTPTYDLPRRQYLCILSGRTNAIVKRLFHYSPTETSRLSRIFQSSPVLTCKSNRLGFKAFMLGYVKKAGVLLTILVCFYSIGRSQTNLYTQDFNSSGGLFPSGWSSNGSSSQWYVYNGNNLSPNPPYSAGYHLVSGNTTNERILTYSNNLSTLGFSNITVTWAARRINNFSPTFEWSSNGTNWNSVSYTDVTNNSTWDWVNNGIPVNLPVGASNISNLRFRWRISNSSQGYRIDDFTVQGCTIPSQPSVINGSTTPCTGTFQMYNVTNVAGVTYTWTFPSGWTQVAGGTTNSVTITVGSGSGTITVVPSNGSCIEIGRAHV